MQSLTSLPHVPDAGLRDVRDVGVSAHRQNDFVLLQCTHARRHNEIRMNDEFDRIFVYVSCI